MASAQARILADYRPSSFTITQTDLTFELDDHQTLVSNVMHIKRIDQDATYLMLDGEHLTLKTININQQPVAAKDYQITESGLRISINPQLTEFVLSIDTQIDPANNTALEGLYKSGDAFCTQCEAEGFRRITYYLDRPDVMSTFTTTVIAEKIKYPYLLSNGNKVEQGEKGSKHFVVWHDPFPKPCYLFALVAGNFDLVADSYTTNSGKEVALEIFVDKGNANKASHAMSSLKHSMRWDEQTFGLEYDLDIYMIVAVDFFNMGAMENKGLNIFNSKFVLADHQSATDTDYFNIEAVIAHEYFHNWTGNRVTCRDWFQLSLKEGLTVFRDQQFSADMNSASVTRIDNVSHLRALQFPEDESPMAHPIRPEKVVEMNNFYTMTVYEKGAEVIRMIHTLLGEEHFRNGMDLYFSRFDGMAVTCDDFVDAMADASGVDLTQFKYWYSQSGTPVLQVTESFNQHTGQLSLTVKQVNQPTSTQQTKHHLHIPIRIELLTEKGSQSHLLELTEEEGIWHFDGYQNKPVVGFLSNFSAPVKVEFEQSDDELMIIMGNAVDDFNRWDAGQTLLIRYITRLIEDPAYELPSSIISTYQQLLASTLDPALKAASLTLPAFDVITAYLEQIDPQKVIVAIEQVEAHLAQSLQETLLEQYQNFTGQPYENQGTATAKRSLKNICLYYLTKLDVHQPLLTEQYQQSDNMTDTLASLSAAGKHATPTFDLLMRDFHDKWQDTTLVMDKWFSLQASANREDIFDVLTVMEQHPLFSMSNPNRARSLISAFSHNNPKYFYHTEGKGYQFLAKQIKALNEINPQIASRLLTPLIQYKRFNDKHRAMMREALKDIASIENLSRDLQEKLDSVQL
ncbi:aminopeptidase N [Thalassotalea sp. 1_MG-2023]|uniref:aminopeptidase N n=1 Tax=Thalassotalea sp. 1_MG-2023 TaxID=3062680 RepID=UPI0026E17FF8|nr:aminopeptidase N [Thalassotalea sp. 1_MG-2023]MDO6426907.1 aminopeptidase N [Thalassotalea sp. 1_MG-2023]